MTFPQLVWRVVMTHAGTVCAFLQINTDMCANRDLDRTKLPSISMTRIISIITKKHSSRMCTTHLLTIAHCIPCRGGEYPSPPALPPLPRGPMSQVGGWVSGIELQQNYFCLRLKECSHVPKFLIVLIIPKHQENCALHHHNTSDVIIRLCNRFQHDIIYRFPDVCG